MSTGCLKKPSRPPPPPPIEYHRLSKNSVMSSKNGHKSKSDYIRISECHTGLPSSHERLSRPMGFKSRASTSFSSTLKPPTSNYLHSSHQKSRSLTDNHLGSSYLYLDLPSTLHSKNNAPTPPSIVYKTVDFMKTDALTKCKVERGKNET